MRILFLSHRIPYPPNKGDKIRSFNEIRHLSKRHEVHLLAFYEYADETRHEKELLKYCRSVTLVPLNAWKQRFRALNAMILGQPWSLGYYSDPVMRNALDDKIGDLSFDLIFVYCSSMAPYATQVEGIPRILDFVDSDALKWKQYSEARRPPLSWLYGYESRKLSQFERRMVREFDYSIFVSRSEIAGHGEKTWDGDIAFIQNGIDLEVFNLLPAGDRAPAVAFAGAMDYYPNVDAVQFFSHEIFPKIRAAHPDARFIIIGSHPVAAVQKLAALPGITVTGTVIDVRPFLSQCRAAVVPLRIAQGIQNKILEALAVGLPVVTTPIAAGELAFVKGLPLAVASDADVFAQQVVRAIEDSPPSPDTLQACRKYLSSHYDWTTNLAALDKIVEEAIARKSSANRRN